jgi:hypothetical protein
MWRGLLCSPQVSGNNKEEYQMAKAKSKAVIMVADGAGGMAQVQDYRFEQGQWPIGV